MTRLGGSTTTAETIPNWITSIAAIGTLIIAGVAAYYARKAWLEAKRQANEAKRQADAAEQELHLTEKQVRRLDEQLAEQRERDQQSRRRDAEARVDALAPTVLAEAHHIYISRYLGNNTTQQVRGPRVHEPGDDGQYRIATTITIKNVSTNTARISLLDAPEEFGSVSGREYVIAPGGEERFTWRRVVSTAMFRFDEVPALGTDMRHRIGVRDLGANVRDTLEFTLGWDFLKREGDHVIVNPKTSARSSIFAAQPVGPRVYERLDAGVAPTSPLGALYIAGGSEDEDDTEVLA